MAKGEIWRADIHVHAWSGEGPRHGEKPKTIVKEARRRGLNAVVLTDHDGEPKVPSINRKGVTIFTAEEVSTAQGHLQVVYLDNHKRNPIPMGLSLAETVDRAHEQNSVIVVPHLEVSIPLVSVTSQAVRDLYQAGRIVDAIETRNPRYTKRHETRAEALADELEIARVGSSDAHMQQHIGWCYTEIPKKTGNLKTDLVIALESRETQAVKDSPDQVPLTQLLFSYVFGLFYNLGGKAYNIPVFAKTLFSLKANKLREAVNRYGG